MKEIEADLTRIVAKMAYEPRLRKLDYDGWVKVQALRLHKDIKHALKCWATGASTLCLGSRVLETFVADLHPTNMPRLEHMRSSRSPHQNITRL